MAYSRPKQFTLSVDTKTAEKYGLRDKHSGNKLEIKSPYKNVSLTAVFDKLISAYGYALENSADERNMYCTFTSLMKYKLEDAIALLAQVAENQNNAIAALNGSQGSSMPTHAMEELTEVWERLHDKNILWLYEKKRFDVIQHYGYVERLLQLKPDAVLPEPANTK